MSVKTVETITAFVAKDASGNEGILAIPSQDGGVMPCIGADGDRVMSLLPWAAIVSTARGVPFRILRWSNPVDVTAEILGDVPPPPAEENRDGGR